MWPIGEFLARELGTSDRRELARAVVARLEPANRSKAFRRVYELLEQGHCPAGLAERLRAAFPDDVAALDEALDATRAMQRRQAQAERDAAFRPHLFVLTELRRPRQITVFGITGGVRRWLQRPLPEGIGGYAVEDQERMIREAVTAHKAEAGDDRPVLLMGRATGYLYRPRPEQSFPVSLDGTVDWQDQGRYIEPRSHVRVR